MSRPFVTPYYEDESVTIYHGDAAEILPKLSGIDAVITDPPYGVNLGSDATHVIGNTPYESFRDTEANVKCHIIPVVCLAMSMAKRVVVTPGTRCCFFYPYPDEIGAIYIPAGAGFSRWGFTCSQPILYYGKDPYMPRNKKPNSFTTTALADDNGHPCPKPLKWMTWLVDRCSTPNETICDPFMGSGTTLRAAKDLGRRAIGIEIEEKYCEIAARGMSQGVLWPANTKIRHDADSAAPQLKGHSNEK